MARRATYSVNPVQGLRETQSALLAPGETYLAAAKARTVPGTPTAEQLPPSMLWGVTDRRLLIWAAPNRGALGAPVVTLEIGPVLNRATIQPYEGSTVAFTVFAGGHPAIVVMDLEDARTIARVIDEVVRASVPPPPVPRLDAEPAPVLMPGERSLGDPDIGAVFDAIDAGDWQDLAARFAALDVPRREIVVASVPGRDALETFDTWVRERPGEPDALLLRGAARVQWAFEELPESTSGMAEVSGSPGAAAFHARLRAAETDLWNVVEAAFDEPVVWTPLIRSARGLQIGQEELCMRFDESVRRTPNLFLAHTQVLVGLSRVWGGSHAVMFAYAESMARPAEEGSPMHALVPFAHILRSIDNVDDDPRQRYFSSSVVRDLSVFAQVSVESPAWTDDATTVEALNIFALAFHLSGELDRARELWRRVDGRRTDEPWLYLPSAVTILEDLKAEGSA